MQESLFLTHTRCASGLELSEKSVIRKHVNGMSGDLSCEWIMMMP